MMGDFHQGCFHNEGNVKRGCDDDEVLEEEMDERKFRRADA
jgi:hypothetical protein